MHANVVDYHTHSVITTMRSAQSPAAGLALSASLSCFSTKLERTRYRASCQFASQNTLSTYIAPKH